MRNTIIALIVVALAAGAWWLLYGVPSSMAPTVSDMMPEADTAAPAGTADAPLAAMVGLTASGFSPKTITIKQGGKVTFVNESGGEMWVASAQHPTHTAYDGTSLAEHCNATPAEAPFDQCGVGTTYSFTFDKTGSWNYHNHVNASQFGTIVVAP